MNIFDVTEIYQFAVQIEENGEKFYRAMVEKFDDPKVKELFDFLAIEEVRHEKVFKEMLAKIEDYNPQESYPGEYFDYLHAYADNLVFTIDKIDEGIESVNTVDEALQFAIGKELDTILYYHEMRNVVPKHQQKLVDDIIDEERKHVVQLTEMKRQLGK
ncbi:MAG: ferritin family protein [Candidatus Cloacimonetes bacterium]|nr:ferritin family protein [Candidatus Cloacimonadota bacterium]